MSYLNTRIVEEIKPTLFGFYLILRYLDKLKNSLLEPIVEEYKNDFPFMDDFPHEIHLCRNNVRNNYVQESCNLETALSYTSDFYPNVNHMKLLLCLTVGSCMRTFIFTSWKAEENGLDYRYCAVFKLRCYISTEVTLWENKKWDASGHRMIALIFDNIL